MNFGALKIYRKWREREKIVKTASCAHDKWHFQVYFFFVNYYYCCLLPGQSRQEQVIKKWKKNSWWLHISYDMLFSISLALPLFLKKYCVCHFNFFCYLHTCRCIILSMRKREGESEAFNSFFLCKVTFCTSILLSLSCACMHICILWILMHMRFLWLWLLFAK